MIKHDTIYKRTSAGKIQVWFMESDENRYRSTSGQLDGKKTTTEWTVVEGKNVGRSNETSPVQQALAEVYAEYEKKLARDYHRQIDTVDEAMRFKPMLATKWADIGPKVNPTNPLFMQPKLDGMRCIANSSGLWTREGKPIFGAPHVFNALKPLFDKFPDTIIDGELYNHKLRHNFNKIVSCAKKQKPTEDDLRESLENLEYHMYDLPSNPGDFHQRYAQLQQLVTNHASIHEYMIIVDTIQVSLNEVDAKAAEYIAMGYEGAMVRLPGKYENKRSKFLVKWKEFMDEEFPILDLQEGDGNRSGMAARAILALPDGRSFSAGLIGDEEYCRQLLIDKKDHIGQLATVVFQNWTPDRVPRFPKMKCMRFDV